MTDGVTRQPGAVSRWRAAVAGGPLGNRSFQLLGMGQLASTVGDLCYAVALPWFVLSSHGGPIELGTVLACYGVPRTVLIAGDETTAPADAEPAPGIWPLLRTSRLLQITLVVIVVANLTDGGTFEVALPALAHARFGAAGYGALIACLGFGALGGTVAAARATNMRKPGIVTYCVYLGEAIAICFVLYLGGLPGAAAAMTVLGACNSFGNILMITMLQQWAPARLLGRIMSLIMLAALGSFPASVAVAGLLIHRLGPAIFFPIAGIVLAITVLASLTQREIRAFGMAPAPGPAESPAPGPAEAS